MESAAIKDEVFETPSESLRISSGALGSESYSDGGGTCPRTNEINKLEAERIRQSGQEQQSGFACPPGQPEAAVAMGANGRPVPVARTTDMEYPPTSAIATKPLPENGFRRRRHRPGATRWTMAPCCGRLGPLLVVFPDPRGHVTYPGRLERPGFPSSGAGRYQNGGPFSRAGREMILLSTLRDFL